MYAKQGQKVKNYLSIDPLPQHDFSNTDLVLVPHNVKKLRPKIILII
jgi:hypothetical protein